MYSNFEFKAISEFAISSQHIFPEISVRLHFAFRFWHFDWKRLQIELARKAKKAKIDNDLIEKAWNFVKSHRCHWARVDRVFEYVFDIHVWISQAQVNVKTFSTLSLHAKFFRKSNFKFRYANKLTSSKNFFKVFYILLIM